VDLLVALLEAIQNNSTQIPLLPGFGEGVKLPAPIVVANVFWFFSLILTLICALTTTLIRQAARDYKRYYQRFRLLERRRTRGALHVMLRTGAERFGLDHASDWILALLHLAVAFFSIGLIIFLSQVNTIVACSSLLVTTIAGTAYAFLSLLPLFHPNCPYRTPFTPFLSFLTRGTRNEVNPTLSHIHFAATRALQRTTEVHEREDFFNSFWPILDGIYGRSKSPDSRVFQMTMRFIDESRIFPHLTALLSNASLGDSVIPEQTSIQRATIACKVGKRLLEIIVLTSGKQDLPHPHRMIHDFCNAWLLFCSEGVNHDPAIQLVARASMAALRASLYHLIGNGSVPWLVNLPMSPPILPVYDSCVCDNYLNPPCNHRPSDGSGAFALHFDLSNLLTMLNDILTAPPHVVQAHSIVWLPLLNEIIDNIYATRLNDLEFREAFQRGDFALDLLHLSPHLSPEFTRVFKNARFAACLLSRPTDVPKAEMLHRYPTLFTAFKMLAAAVSQKGIVRGQEVLHLFTSGCEPC
jgi:hypothetical protein